MTETDWTELDSGTLDQERAPGWSTEDPRHPTGQDSLLAAVSSAQSSALTPGT